MDIEVPSEPASLSGARSTVLGDVVGCLAGGEWGGIGSRDFSNRGGSLNSSHFFLGRTRRLRPGMELIVSLPPLFCDNCKRNKNQETLGGKAVYGELAMEALVRG